MKLFSPEKEGGDGVPKKRNLLFSKENPLKQTKGKASSEKQAIKDDAKKYEEKLKGHAKRLGGDDGFLEKLGMFAPMLGVLLSVFFHFGTGVSAMYKILMTWDHDVRDGISGLLMCFFGQCTMLLFCKCATG
jgi:hypothetical protein